RRARAIGRAPPPGGDSGRGRGPMGVRALSYNTLVIGPLLKSLRPSQWAKNAFVLAPLVFSGLLLDRGAVVRGLLALAAFCCAASSVYLVNDLRDRDEDRRHPLKRLRPLAAGTLPVAVAVAAL